MDLRHGGEVHRDPAGEARCVPAHELARHDRDGDGERQHIAALGGEAGIDGEHGPEEDNQTAHGRDEGQHRPALEP